MQKKPVDPLLARVREEPVWHVDDAAALYALVISGLPECKWWRHLVAGEPTRPGDYCWEKGTQRWSIEYSSHAADNLVFRPMGDDCQVFFVGESKVSPHYRTGEHDKPYETVGDALAHVGNGAYLIYEIGGRRPRDFRDPANWDWARYLATKQGTSEQAETSQAFAAQQDRVDNLRDLLEHQPGDGSEAFEQVPDTELREK